MLQSISPRFVRAPFATLLDDDSDQSYVLDIEDEIFNNGPSVRDLKIAAPQLFDSKLLRPESWQNFLAREEFLATSLAEIKDHLLNREFDFSNSLVLHPLPTPLFVALLSHQQTFLIATAQHILNNLKRIQTRIQDLNRTAFRNFSAVKVSLKLTLNSTNSPYDRSSAILKGITACKQCLAQCTESIDSDSLNVLVDETVELLYDYNQALEHHSTTASTAGRASSISVGSASGQHANLEQLRNSINAIETMVGEGTDFVSKECSYMTKLVDEVKSMFDGYLAAYRRFIADGANDYDTFMFLGQVI